jgi:hypothetical protein
MRSLVITLATDKRLGLADLDQWRLQGNAPVAGEGEAGSVVVPPLDRTSFRGFSIVQYCPSNV